MVHISLNFPLFCLLVRRHMTIDMSVCCYGEKRSSQLPNSLGIDGLLKGISYGCRRRGEREREFRLRRVSDISSLDRLFRCFQLRGSSSSPAPKTFSSAVDVRKSNSAVLFSFSFSFWRFHINFLTHFPHRATFTKADLFSPCSTYENGSSNVVNEGLESSPWKWGAKWCWHRVFPQVVSPEPERTSSSVLQRSANWHWSWVTLLFFGRDGRDKNVRCQICSV